MPHPLFLHIRARARGATRVISIAGDVVRIGRGRDCDARLDDPSIAEVECFLRRHGETWHVQPLSDRARLTIDGRAVTHLRAIALGVALRVGDSILVLRDTAAVPTEFRPVEIPDADPFANARPSASLLDDDERLGDRPYTDPVRAREARASAKPAVVAPDRSTAPPRRRATTAERLWEARWRAVGRSIRSQPPTLPSHPRRAEPAGEPGPDIVPFVARIAPEDVEPPIAPEPPIVEEHDFSTSISEVKVHWRGPVEAIATTITEVIPFEFPEARIEPIPPPIPIPEEVRQIEVTDRESLPEHTPSTIPPRQRLAPATDDHHDDWPSVSAILANCPPRTVSAVRPRPKKCLPMPTEAGEPRHWSPPRFLVFLAGAASIALFGSVGIYLAWMWGRDDFEAGALADRLLQSNAKAGVTISEEEINPDGTWWRTTASHLAIRSAALGTGRGDAGREESAKFLLDTARAVAPLEPATRLARAELESRANRGEVPLSALGLSRDTLSLALTARALAQAGKTDAALSAYRAALEIVVRSNLGRGTVSALADESESKRFALPSEPLVMAVVGEMAGQPGWTFASWSGALPQSGLAWLCAYRVLKERSSADSETALARLVDLPDPPDRDSLAVHRAARAEGLALLGRFEDSNRLYAEAIAIMPEVAVARTWHLNRAVILSQGHDPDKVEEAVMAAQAGRGDDEIGRKVSQALNLTGIGGKKPPTPDHMIQKAN